MKVIHLSVECFPVAKVGGLADVVGALPKYQRKLGIDASVVLFIRDQNNCIMKYGKKQVTNLDFHCI
jgi:glycogen synthase